jgi:hypothetical protein
MKTSKDVIDLFLSEAPKLKIIISNDFGELNEDQLNFKPSPDKWSIGECIDHLVVSHDQYLNKIRKINVEGIPPGTNSDPYKHSLFGKLLINAVSPEATRKVKTFRVFNPGHKLINIGVVDEYHRSLDELIEIAEKFKWYDLNKIKISSPILNFIRLNLGDAFIIHLNHDSRHINQAKKGLEKIEVYH